MARPMLFELFEGGGMGGGLEVAGARSVGLGRSGGEGDATHPRDFARLRRRPRALAYREESVKGSVAPGFAPALALAVASACVSRVDSPPATSVVVGIQSEGLTGALGTLHVVTTLGTVVSSDVLIPPAVLPYEVRVTDPGGEANEAVAVRVEGYQASGWTPGSSEPPLLVRAAETHFVAHETSLLRVMLEGQCLLGLPGGPPGAPSCASPQTCIDGACQADAVPAQALEPYASDWAIEAPDICKPAHAGAPVVQVGTGQTDYLPTAAGQTVQMEQGPQGGHHVWIAVRQENLKQSGSVTTVTSVVPLTGLAGPRSSFAFTFDTDEGGFCKLFGLRYQLDVDGTDYREFLGKPLDVTVTIKDASGATGVGLAHLNIDPQLLCPSGISGCS